MINMGKTRSKKVLISEFYCTKCGNRGIDLVRNKNQREAGHLKKLYCLHCQEQKNFVEIRPASNYTYDDFLMELHHGNFTEDGKRRVASYKQFEAYVYDGIWDETTYTVKPKKERGLRKEAHLYEDAKTSKKGRDIYEW